MKQSFVTVFQTSYSSNGYLPILILCVLAGLIIALLVLFKRGSSGTRFPTVPKMIFLGLWIPVWLFGFALAVGMLISYGHKYTRALADGQCNIVEGPVLLIRQQPKSGARLWLRTPRQVSFASPGQTIAQGRLAPPATNAPGDIVQVGDRKFLMNFYSLGLGYQQTAAHGGVLTNGAYARLHYLGNTIVKVEVRQ